MSQPRILIVKMSSLGDILHVLPTVQALRDQMGASIDWATQPEYVALVECFDCVDRVIGVERRFTGKCPGLAELRRHNYDIAIDLHGLFKSARVMRASRAKRKIGPSFARELSFLAYDERVGKADRRRHAVDQAMDVLDYLGLKRPTTAVARINYPEAKLTPADWKIAIAPVSRWRTKNWPIENFAELARLLAGEAGARIFVAGARADYDLAETIRSSAPESVENLCGRYTIPEMFGVLRDCDLLIANDTGPVHMAVAIGRPTLVLFGPTSPMITGPYGEGNSCVSGAGGCLPCRLGLRRRGRHSCMAGITPGEVLARARAMRAARVENSGRKGAVG